jgi:hypothetical protein
MLQETLHQSERQGSYGDGRAQVLREPEPAAEVERLPAAVAQRHQPRLRTVDGSRPEPSRQSTTSCSCGRLNSDKRRRECATQCATVEPQTPPTVRLRLWEEARSQPGRPRHRPGGAPGQQRSSERGVRCGARPRGPSPGSPGGADRRAGSFFYLVAWPTWSTFGRGRPLTTQGGTAGRTSPLVST